jgi:hypothetical protein
VSTISERQNDNVWLTAKEAADRARLCPEVFRRKVRKGRGPVSYGVSRLKRFLARDVDSWIRAGMGGGSS